MDNNSFYSLWSSAPSSPSHVQLTILSTRTLHEISPIFHILCPLRIHITSRKLYCRISLVRTRRIDIVIGKAFVYDAFLFLFLILDMMNEMYGWRRLLLPLLLLLQIWCTHSPPNLFHNIMFVYVVFILIKFIVNFVIELQIPFSSSWPRLHLQQSAPLT